MLTNSGVTRGISHGGQNLAEGAHWPPFRYAIIRSQKRMHVIPQKQKIVVGCFNVLQLGE